MMHSLPIANLILGLSVAAWLGTRQTGCDTTERKHNQVSWAIYLLLATGSGLLIQWQWIAGGDNWSTWTGILGGLLALSQVFCWIGWIIPPSEKRFNGILMSVLVGAYLLIPAFAPDVFSRTFQFQVIQLALAATTLRFCWLQISTPNVTDSSNLMSNNFYLGAILLGIILQSFCNTLIFFTIHSPLASFCTWIITVGCFSFSIMPIALAKATLCYPKPHSTSS